MEFMKKISVSPLNVHVGPLNVHPSKLPKIWLENYTNLNDYRAMLEKIFNSHFSLFSRSVR